MDTYIESKPYLHEIGKQAYTTSTFKIPRKLLPYLYMREAAFGSRREYFSHLIRTNWIREIRFQVGKQNRR